MLDAGCRTVIRLLRLLRWFVVPIFLLHALLSPGELVLPGSPVPLTWEGMSQGLWLGIHFCAIFIVAMLMFRLLLRSEWLYGLLSMPLVGKRSLVYLLMIAAMRKNIVEQLSHMKQQWKLRPDWRSAAGFVLASFRMALAAGKEQAWMLWLRWPEYKAGMCMHVSVDGGNGKLSVMLSAVWAMIGIAVLVLGRQ